MVYETKRGKKLGLTLYQWIDKKIKDKEKQELERKKIIESRYWKKYVPLHIHNEVNGKVIKTDSDIPFFDHTYWDTDFNKDFVLGKSVYSSKEMMEWFLKEVGGKSSLDDYANDEKERNFNNHIVKITTSWTRLVFAVEEEKIKGELYCREHAINSCKWFAELEHLITNNDMFWSLFPTIWTHGNQHLKCKHMFERYGRDKVPFERRMKCANAIEEYTVPTGEKIVYRDDHHYNLPKILKTINSAVRDDGYIYVYRSFKMKVGSKFHIREKIKKYDDTNKLNSMQMKGKGYSYTFDKTTAIGIAKNLTTYHLKKYLGKNDKGAKRLMNKLLSPIQRKDPTHYDGYYHILGQYRIKKENIIFYTDCRSEDEILAHPNDAELLDYRFLNIIDYLTTNVITSICATTNKLGGGVDVFNSFKNEVV